MSKKIPLGAKVRDRVSGLAGVATARTEYLYSTPQIRVTPDAIDATGNLRCDAWLEEAQVEPAEEKRPAGYTPKEAQ